jgi:hypothetical protein
LEEEGRNGTKGRGRFESFLDFLFLPSSSNTASGGKDFEKAAQKAEGGRKASL